MRSEFLDTLIVAVGLTATQPASGPSDSFNFPVCAADDSHNSIGCVCASRLQTRRRMVSIRTLAWPTPSLTQTPQQKDGPDETCVALRGVCVPGESRLPDPLAYGKPAMPEMWTGWWTRAVCRLRRRVQYRQSHPTTCPRSPRTTTSKSSRPDRRPRAYAYPYYTVRGPRDFFLNEPSTIGY